MEPRYLAVMGPVVWKITDTGRCKVLIKDCLCWATDGSRSAMWYQRVRAAHGLGWSKEATSKRHWLKQTLKGS